MDNFSYRSGDNQEAGQRRDLRHLPDGHGAASVPVLGGAAAVALRPHRPAARPLIWPLLPQHDRLRQPRISSRRYGHCAGDRQDHLHRGSVLLSFLSFVS